jgi:carbamoyl-phosphate synthase small subunit
MDLAKEVTCREAYEWAESIQGSAFSVQGQPSESRKPNAESYHVVAVDYGAKLNILRCLVSAGCKVTVVPAQTTADEIFRLKPDGVFLSNGPGDPAATSVYAVPVVKAIMERGTPLFGICLGHQLMALALGGHTAKMKLGHHGANHPVKDLQTGKVEITSQNHGFVVLPESLPPAVEVTHVSLFDGTNEGLRVKDKPAFCVQYHPEASPGPHDSHYLFHRFLEMIEKHKASRRAA